MARSDLTLFLTIRRRWWVAPYMALSCLFLWSVAWILDDNDERVSAFIDRNAEFIGRHGSKIVATSEDPGEV